MKYKLNPRVNITEVSSTKVQVSHCLHTITIENQNDNIQQLIKILTDEEVLPINTCSNKEDLQQLLDLFIECHFVIKSNHTDDIDDALANDLTLLNMPNKALITTNQPSFHQDLDTSAVYLLGEGVLCSNVNNALKKLNINIKRELKPKSKKRCLIICCDDKPNARYFCEINALAQQYNLPVIFGCISGATSVIGPFVIPNDTSCYQCYKQRYFANLKFTEEAKAIDDHLGNLACSQPSANLYAIEASFHLVSQAVKFFNQAYQFCLFNEVLSVNLIDYQIDIQPVIRVPHCCACHAKSQQKPLTAIRALD